MHTGAVLGKILGGWPLINWEATTAKRNYYRTNYIEHLEKLGLNYPEKKFWARFGGLSPWPQHRTATACIYLPQWTLISGLAWVFGAKGQKQYSTPPHKSAPPKSPQVGKQNSRSLLRYSENFDQTDFCGR